MRGRRRKKGWTGEDGEMFCFSGLPKDNKLFTEDTHLSEYQDLAEHEDLRVKPLFFHRPSIASTCDSAESIATRPPDSDLDDDHIRALLASPLYPQRSLVCHSVRENLMSSSSQDPTSTGRPSALLFSNKNRLNPETFSHREDFSLKTSTGFGKQ